MKTTHNIILGIGGHPTLPEWCSVDLNLNLSVDILDILIIINIILEI